MVIIQEVNSHTVNQSLSQPQECYRQQHNLPLIRFLSHKGTLLVTVMNFFCDICGFSYLLDIPLNKDSV